MKNTLWKTWAGVSVLALCGLIGAAVAFGAGGTTTPSHPREAALTGDTATKAKAAAVAKVGGTADSATTENDSSNAAAAYEVHVTKTDGTHVTVILDKDYSVLTVETGHGPGGLHHGNRH